MTNSNNQQEVDEIHRAMGEAKGYNLVSKSMKTLPTVNNMNGTTPIIDKTSRDKISKYI